MNIFDIIMPWVAEKREEDKQRKQAEAAAGKRGAVQKSLSSFFKPKKGKKAPAAGEDIEMEEEKKEVDDVDLDEKLEMLSKVVKTGSVETFDWEYQDRKLVNGRTKSA